MSDHHQHLDEDQDSYLRRVVPSRNSPSLDSQRAMYRDLSDFSRQGQCQTSNNAPQQWGSRLGSNSAFQNYSSSTDTESGGAYVKSPLRGLEAEYSRPTFSPGPMLPIESMQRNDNNSRHYEVHDNLNQRGGSSMSVQGGGGGFTPGPRKTAGSASSESPQYGAFTLSSPLASASEEFSRNVMSVGNGNASNPNPDMTSNEGSTKDGSSIGRAQESSPDNLLRFVDFIRVGMGEGDTWGQMGNTYPAPPSFSYHEKRVHMHNGRPSRRAAGSKTTQWRNG